MRILLTVTSGPHLGRVFAFAARDTFLVGRSRRAQFHLPARDTFCSRAHFMVEVDSPHCRLIDMGSANGTYVNGRKVATVDLHDGDSIRAGRTIFRVLIEDPSMPQRATPLTPSPQPDVIAVPITTSGPAHSCAFCAAHAPAPAQGAAICEQCQKRIESQAQPVPGYRIVREVSKEVYQALRVANGSAVALKTLSGAAATPTTVHRFLREARILMHLDHAHIAAYHEHGEAGGLRYLATDLVRGPSTEQEVTGRGPLPVGRAVGLVCQLLLALQHVHDRGFVHRDIKPRKMLLANEAGREVVKLIGFGLARAYQPSELSSISMLGDMGGTPAFMPPEQITHYREAKPPVDQYAAAGTLYHLLTGKFIYDLPRTVQKQLLMILQEDAVPIQQRRPDLPDRLAGIIHRALAREPAERYPDITALRNDLLPFAS